MVSQVPVNLTKNSGEPRVLLALEMRILPQPKRRHRARGRLVRLLDTIAQPHEREKVQVDFPLQLLVLFFGVLAFSLRCCVLSETRFHQRLSKMAVLTSARVVVGIAAIGRRSLDHIVDGDFGLEWDYFDSHDCKSWKMLAHSRISRLGTGREKGYLSAYKPLFKGGM